MIASFAPFVLFAALAALAVAQSPEEAAEPVAGADLRAARAAAAKNDRRVLVLEGSGGPADAVGAAMEDDRDLREKLLYEYDVVHRAGAGSPAVAIFDPDGAAVARVGLSRFTDDDGGGVDEEALLAFLTEHQPARRSAVKILAAAKARAAAEGKRVFVHFGAPWCGNCHEFEEWMARDDVRPLLEKEFVDCKVDIDRTRYGRRLLDRMRTGEPGGIPWFCFLAPTGETLVESNRASDGKNVGFPRGEENRAHVRAMLETGVVHLTDEEIDALVGTLP